MSHWLHKNLHKQHLLLLKLAALCFLFHCILFIWIFFIYNNCSYSVSLSLHKHLDYSAPILFVPISSTTKTSQQKTAVASPQKPPSAPVQKNNSAKIEATTLAVEKKVVCQPSKPVLPATQPPQASPIKKTPEKAATPPIKKETPEKTPEPSPKIEKKDPLPAPQHISPPISTAPENPRIIPENAIISDNYKEVEALRRNALLQKELVNNWRPPVGTSKGTACEVSFFVDTNGGIKQISIIKSSGIAMYDISARQALFSMKMPQWTQGKTVTITFMQ